jgi:hypothetical protein
MRRQIRIRIRMVLASPGGTAGGRLLVLPRCHTAVILMLHHSYTVIYTALTSLYTAFILLLRCCYTTVTLLLHRCYIIVTPPPPPSKGSRPDDSVVGVRRISSDSVESEEEARDATTKYCEYNGAIDQYVPTSLSSQCHLCACVCMYVCMSMCISVYVCFFVIVYVCVCSRIS